MSIITFCYWKKIGVVLSVSSGMVLAQWQQGSLAMNNESFILRPALPNDASSLSKIRYDAILALASSKIGKERAKIWAESATDDRVLSAIENHEVWIAIKEEEAIGWIEIAQDTIKGLYVQPDSSFGGIGSSLLRHAEGRILSMGFPIALLDASSNAEKFYRRRGYKPLSGRTAEDALPMVKVLTGRSTK